MWSKKNFQPLRIGVSNATQRAHLRCSSRNPNRPINVSTKRIPADSTAQLPYTRPTDDPLSIVGAPPAGDSLSIVGASPVDDPLSIVGALSRRRSSPGHRRNERQSYRSSPVTRQPFPPEHLLLTALVAEDYRPRRASLIGALLASRMRVSFRLLAWRRILSALLSAWIFHLSSRL
jgi:hypothetical protein